MTLTGYKTYSCTAAELAALPDYYQGLKLHGDYALPVGRYVGRSTDGLLAPMICDVVSDPLQGTRETWSRIVIEEGV